MTGADRSALTREIVTWLEAPDATLVGARTRSWSPATWAGIRQVIVVQGVAPHLSRIVSTTGLADVLPPDIVVWLAEQDGLNTRRLARMHEELAAILARATATGIQVMPLKGALLTTSEGPQPYRRPMADLDLLVRPADRGALGAVLEGLGYVRRPERHRRPTHDVFMDPGGGRVVTTEAEHPDNPRRVEVHTEVRRHLWGWIDDDDLTPALWSGAGQETVLGQPATVPRPASLFAHLAIHATSDLLVGRGRLVQWLDLAHVAASAGDLADVPHPRLAYPALRLAARMLLAGMAALDISRLEARVPPHLARWAATVPLDERCGLSMGRPPDAPSSFGARWERWRPERWRLSVAYGDAPLPVALSQYAFMLARRARARA